MPLLCAVLLGGLTTVSAAQQSARPVGWGVDDAGTRPYLLDHPKAAEVFEEFGFDFWVTHYHFSSPKIELNRAGIRRVDDWCADRGVEWIANLESPNFVKAHVDEKGRDWYNRDDGRHFFLFPEELLEEFGCCRALWGFMYDEAAHMQNCRNKIAGLDKPWIFDPEGQTLTEAAEEFTRAVGEVREIHAEHGIRLSTEHVFPVLYHGFARAGWTAGTKVLKENWSPAYIACAMGAALEYGTELWVTPDLWFGGSYPGHSTDEYRSALLLAYHMGADRIYTENLSFDHDGKGTGSLVLLSEDDYRVTPHGEVAKWFWHEYVPAHPRPYTFRDIRPRVAIVRQPDACWGQSNSWLPNTLFGHKEWQSNPTTEAWLQIWHLLSRGVIPEYTLSWHHLEEQGRPYQVFCPLDGVVVYDHLVGQGLLKDADVIFLTGLGVSERTRRAIGRCVKRGATCVALPHLLPGWVRRKTGDAGHLRSGEGLWVATESFLADAVREHVEHVIPREDVIRYRFGDNEVAFSPIDGNPNRLTVKVQHEP
jgi:hypothetical protein